MGLIGIDQVVYGVEDMAQARKFLDDWGVKPLAQTDAALEYETADGSGVWARPKDANDLPAAVEGGNTLRRIIWGAQSKEDLQRIAAELSKDRKVAEDKDGTIHSTDPHGLGISFRVSKKRPIKIERAPVNTPTHVERVDMPAPIYDHAVPQRIGHMVMAVPDQEAAERFYTDRLGFTVSDRYPGWATFLRCSPEGDHHNLFFMKHPEGRVGLNHVAFTVRDVHEVFGGGLNVSRKGWKTEVGPGRHPVSSAYFWYFMSPLGGANEYYADEDHLTPKWKPRELKRSPQMFAEWALQQGIDETRRPASVAHINEAKKP